MDLQYVVAQSAAAMQPLPTGQPAQLPPQSRSVSVPLTTPSLQVGTAHVIAVHTPLAQSPPTLHPRPSPHAMQSPPQSTSGSLPLATPSVHVGVAHVMVAPQTPL
jgi:hypothetical protein